MGLGAVLQEIENHNRRIVAEETWGHLAPRKNKKYRGRIVYALEAYHSRTLRILISDFEELGCSPWFYNAIHSFIAKLDEDKYQQEGCVYEWKGTFRNYVMEGETRLLLDANDPNKQIPWIR